KYITHCDVYFSKRKKVYITLDFGDKLSKRYCTHCDVYFSKRKKVYITLDFGDKLSKRYCTQIRTYEFLQMLISETEAYQDLNIDTLF
ncbi:hypothetical protein, partial [Blautia sp. OF11-22]|uniref:hypothetical protein n=1 Tax=Blautia sp. OF11-22 TaxID=2292982 RepID=UPI000FF6F522